MRRLAPRAAGSRVAGRAGPAVPAGADQDRRLRRRLRAVAFRAVPEAGEPAMYQRGRCAEAESVVAMSYRSSQLMMEERLSY